MRENNLEHLLYKWEGISASPSLASAVLFRLGLEHEGAFPPTSLESLAEALQDEKWQIRLSAIRRLRLLQGQDVDDLLAAAVDDENEFVRMTAEQALRGRSGHSPLTSATESSRSIKVFCSYAREDALLQAELKNYLTGLDQQNLVGEWYEHEIEVGRERQQATAAQLNNADIVLLLISPDFIDSEYCYSIDMKRALLRHEAGEAHVIPVILRLTDIEKTFLGRLNTLPKSHIPVVEWASRNEAFLDVARGIKEVVEELSQKSSIPIHVQLQELGDMDKKQAILSEMSRNDRKFSPNLRLRKAREERGWSQRELANKVGTTSVNVSRWENGSTFPYPYSRQRLREVFGKTLEELALVPPSEHDEPGLVPPPAHRSRIWNIPIMHNPFFTGREDLLALLHERLSTAKMAALTQVQAQSLHGLGGIGKTQTAAEYAFRYGDDYSNVFWIRAASRETLVADFVTLAQLLEFPEKDEQDQRRVVAAVKHWLAAHEGWLLIMDNADDLPLAQEFLPTSHKGYILFTTRAQAAGPIAASVEVEKLNLQEGTLLLLRWTKLLDLNLPLDHAKTAERVAAKRIVKEMEGLPLAIVQAGGYMEETGCGLTDYLSLYAAHRKGLLARHSNLLLDYPDTVATTWSLSFQQVEQESPAAADVLRLCAFLAPDAIPEELLTRSTAELGVVLGAEALDPFKLNEALEVLRRYSLVKRDGNTHMLSIHRLVQIVLKESLDQETQRAWAERTVRAVNAAFPEGYYDTDKNHRYYLPHVQECAMLITQYHLYFPEAARLLHRAGVVLHFHGFYPQSQSLHRQALAVREQVFGSEHPAVADSLNALALLSRFQGDYGQAEDFHRQALAIREKTLGPNHLATGQSLNNLAVLYRTQGKYEQAEPLLHRALIISEQSLGSEHPDTLYSFLNLAKLYLEQRKYEQAEPLAKQALATSTRVLEPEHRIIAQVLSLLARLSYEQGNYEQAETLWKQALAIVEKTFGPEHPSTAERLNDLAELYIAQGRLTQAESLCRRALSICEHMLGSEHPDTITYRQHLAKILSKKEMEQDSDYHAAPPLH